MLADFLSRVLQFTPFLLLQEAFLPSDDRDASSLSLPQEEGLCGKAAKIRLTRNPKGILEQLAHPFTAVGRGRRKVETSWVDTPNVTVLGATAIIVRNVTLSQGSFEDLDHNDVAGLSSILDWSFTVR